MRVAAVVLASLLSGSGALLAQAAAPADEAALQAAADRGSVRALLALADLRGRRGDLAGTAEPLRRALSLAPNSERVLAAYARSAMAARAPAQALLALEPLARMHPTTVDYGYLLGLAWLQLGDAPAALEPLEHARQLEPGRALTLAALGLAFNQQKRYDEARAVLDEALRHAPDDPEMLALLAEAEEGQGQLAAAEQHARRALERMPGHATALHVLGVVHMRGERYAEARRAFEASLATDPESARTHYQLSQACARLGDQDCAAREVERYQVSRRAAEERVKQLYSHTLDREGPTP